MTRPRCPLMLVCALAAMTLGCQTGGGDGAPPTAEEAHRFIEAAEKRLEALGKKASRAAWVQNNFITVDTQKIAADAQSDFAAAVTELAPGARRFEGLPAPVRRRPQAQAVEAAALGAGAGQSMPSATNYRACRPRSKATTEKASTAAAPKANSNASTSTRHRTSSRRAAIRTSSSMYGRAGIGWARPCAIGTAASSSCPTRVRASSGFADTGVLWRSNYDMPPDAFAAEVDRLWTQVQPLYASLHTYVRSKLAEKYGAGVLPGERHAAGASPGQHVGAGLEQHLSAGGPAGVGGGLRPDSGSSSSERSTSAGW